MLETVKLLLPAVIPSWRFFDTITASPRLEFRLFERPDVSGDWQEFRPRPAHVSFGTMLKRLFWNPGWNETLFLVSCAERLVENQTGPSAQEIAQRIETELAHGVNKAAPYGFQFRLLFIGRQGEQVQKQTRFTSIVYCYVGNIVP